MVSGPIQFLEPDSRHGAEILQLYPMVELFADGEPAANTLFVMGRSGEAALPPDQSEDQLLLIDPPADAAQRFKLQGNVAVVFTGKLQEIGLPALKTEAGGLAHIRGADRDATFGINGDDIGAGLPGRIR